MFAKLTPTREDKPWLYSANDDAKRYHTVFISFDGTAVDSGHAPEKVLCAISGKYGQKKYERMAYPSQGATPLAWIWDRILKARFRREFTQRYNRYLFSAKPINMTTRVLHSLMERRFRVVIVTFTDAPVVEGILHRCGLSHLGIDILCHSFAEGLYPSTVRYLRSRRIDKDRTILIGSSPRDIDAGNRSGIDTVFAHWGTGAQNDIACHYPTHEARDPAELFDILAGYVRCDATI